MEQINDMIKEMLASGAGAMRPDTQAILVSLAAALALSALMWGTYRLANTAAGYQPRFGTTLVALALLSTVLMDLIQSNLALSLGMLGSLSIVRFRTNIRDPRDIGFIFWSMAIGLASATGSYFIGGVGSGALAVFMILTRRRGEDAPDMMLVIRGSNADIAAIHSIVAATSRRNAVKAKNMLSDSFELVYEVKLAASQDDKMIWRLFELGGIDSVNLLADQRPVA